MDPCKVFDLYADTVIGKHKSCKCKQLGAGICDWCLDIIWAMVACDNRIYKKDRAMTLQMARHTLERVKWVD